MKTHFHKQILMITILYMAISCTSNDDPIAQNNLPPITQTGANTFGCVINGEVLIPKDGIGVPQPRGISVKYRPNNNFIIDAGNLKDTGGDDIYIYIYNLTTIGTYNLGLSNNQSDISFTPNYPHIFCRTYDDVNEGRVYLSNTNAGIVNITRFDSDNHIVSGTFELTVFNKDNPNETIEITEGRFDINWETL